MGFTVPVPAYSYTLTDGVHDRSNDPAFLGSNIPGICAECHVPHEAFEIRLWGRDLGGAAEVDDLCIDCHDGAAPAWASSAQNVAKVKLSYHDFSDNPGIAPRGSCSACHDLHAPNDNTAAYVGTSFTSANLWIRDLTGEFTDLDQKRNLGSNTPPNYLIGATVLCYDCHAGDPANNGPGATDFSPDPLPQDIAFGGDGSDGDSRGTVLAGGEIAGYYELPDGSEPDGSTGPTTAEVQAGAVPGGHFVKSKMGGGTVTNYSVNDPDFNLLYEISVGDKLPCDLCHDPHAGYDSLGSAGSGEDEVFFRRKIYAGQNKLMDRNADNEFDDLRASPASRNNSGGTGRYMCIYCHGTSDWDGNVFPASGKAPLLTETGAIKRSVYGIKTMVGNASTVDASNAFPPPLGPSEHTEGSIVSCTGCHEHNNINASCGGCHEWPPTTGAHFAHSSTADGKPEFDCETCHGPNPGSSSWHNDSNVSSYSSTDNFGEITLMPELVSAGIGTAEHAYYYSTWSRTGLPAGSQPSVSKSPGYQFTCTNVACHGMDTVNWTWTANENSVGGTSSEAGYRVCGGCHGMAADIDSDGALDPDRLETGKIDVASFYSRSSTLYQATNAAANYLRPVSCFSRGGHGDINIYNESPYIETAPGSDLPVACGTCHDAAAPHFTGITSNPYRLFLTGFSGSSGQETAITNLCSQTNCHPKQISGSDYAVLEKTNDNNQAVHRHPLDYWPLYGGTPTTYYISVSDKYVVRSGSSSTSDPKYDPVGVTPAVTTHIDRYVDHWAWWNAGTPATSGNSNDDLPFIPLGNSLAKGSGDAFDNTVNTTDGLVTCTTCHNPHGTDLYVLGEDPDSSCASTLQAIPDNNMLRLRVDDGGGEMCDACHLP